MRSNDGGGMLLEKNFYIFKRAKSMFYYLLNYNHLNYGCGKTEIGNIEWCFGRAELNEERRTRERGYVSICV